MAVIYRHRRCTVVSSANGMLILKAKKRTFEVSFEESLNMLIVKL